MSGRDGANEQRESDSCFSPPCTNRGIEVHADCLAITVWENPSRVFPLVYKHLSGLEPPDRAHPLQPRPHGARGFNQLWFGPDDSRFYGYPVAERTTYCAYELGGAAISTIGCFRDRVLALKRAIDERDIVLRCSRLDIAWDHCPSTPREAYDNWLAGDVVTRIRKEHHMWISSIEGNTLYLESSKGDKRIRVYDRRSFTRCEFQARKDNAHAVLMDYLYYSENLTAWLCGTVSWKAPWFQSLLAAPVRLKAAKSNEALLIPKFQKHLLRLLPTLKIAKELFGGSVDSWLNDNDYDLSPIHLGKLKRLRSELHSSPELGGRPH